MIPVCQFSSLKLSHLALLAFIANPWKVAGDSDAAEEWAEQVEEVENFGAGRGLSPSAIWQKQIGNVHKSFPCRDATKRNIYKDTNQVCMNYIFNLRQAQGLATTTKMPRVKKKMLASLEDLIRWRKG